MTLQDVLPSLIPLAAIQLSLLAYVIWHILSHEHYRRGNRTIWLIIVILGMEFIGPLLYLALGKEDA